MVDDFNYFITWAKQKDALTLPVEKTKDFSFYLKDGSKVIDALSAAYNVSFGYSEDRIKEKIRLALDNLPSANSKWTFDLKENVSVRLKSLLGFQSGKIFYTNSGAESIENALKIARDIRGKNIVLSRSCSYHGASLGALSVSGDWRNEAVNTIDDWTARIPEPKDDPNAEELRKIIEKAGAENIAAICLETITGANGVIEAPVSWWKEIQSVVSATGIILILDEVLTGFCRTGENFAFQKYPNLKPDIVCMAKGITGGYVPFGALWLNKEISSVYNDKVLPCGLTTYAHPLGISALSGVLEILENKEERSKITNNIKIFSSNLEKLIKKDLIKNLRLTGMLAYFELDFSPTLKELVDAGIFASIKKNSLILSPAITIFSEDLEKIFINLEQLILERTA